MATDDDGDGRMETDDDGRNDGVQFYFPHLTTTMMMATDDDGRNHGGQFFFSSPLLYV
jgi:hypothetical protein